VFAFIYFVVTNAANLTQRWRIYLCHQFSPHTNDALMESHTFSPRHSGARCWAPTVLQISCLWDVIGLLAVNNHSKTHNISFIKVLKCSYSIVIYTLQFKGRDYSTSAWSRFKHSSWQLEYEYAVHCSLWCPGKWQLCRRSCQVDSETRWRQGPGWLSYRRPVRRCVACVVVKRCYSLLMMLLLLRSVAPY